MVQIVQICQAIRLFNLIESQTWYWENVELYEKIEKIWKSETWTWNRKIGGGEMEDGGVQIEPGLSSSLKQAKNFMQRNTATIWIPNT